ncbi:MAG: hypothetical protein ACK2U5_11860, partial [Candidatus Promineifilaceae bacterium]
MNRRISFVLVLLMVTFVGGLAIALPRAAMAEESAAQTYLIVYKQHKVPADAAAIIAAAGGSLAYAYDQIGVAVA